MLTEVLVVKLSHKVGQLQVLLAKICKAGINIDYFLFHHSLGLWGKGINKTRIGKEPLIQRVIRV